MATLNCEAPGCEEKKTAESVATAMELMKLHDQHAHPPVQEQAAPTAMGYKARKIKRPKVCENENDEVWTQF